MSHTSAGDRFIKIGGLFPIFDELKLLDLRKEPDSGASRLGLPLAIGASEQILAR